MTDGFNYDVDADKVVGLSDFFTGKNYLADIATLASTDVLGRNINDDKAWLATGLAATDSNYKHYTLDKDSINFFLEQYQVASRPFGIVVIRIPYDKLSADINPAGPLAGLQIK